MYAKKPLAEKTPLQKKTDLKPKVENPALTSFINKIVEQKKNLETKNKYVIENYDLRPRILSPQEHQSLAEKIRLEFKGKNLHKGATEVYNAITYMDLKAPQAVYVAGYLDLAYEEGLLKAITQVHRHIDVRRLGKEYRSFVHECIKDVNLRENTERIQARRAFNCRVFVV